MPSAGESDERRLPRSRSDGLGRRPSCVRTGAAFDGAGGASADPHNDAWGYNGRNELTATDRFSGFGASVPAGGTAVPTLDRAYAYDPIGNRLISTEGTAAALHCCANELNQYVATDTAADCPPPVTEAFVHDLDGNLTQDGTYDYAWDAENNRH
jgi:hypothetical protein